MFEIAYGIQVYRDKYGALTRLEVTADGGDTEDAIKVLTGSHVETLHMDCCSMATLRERLEDAMARDAVVAASTLRETEKDEEYTGDGLVRSHAYSILGFADDVALVRNPWGGTTGGLKGQDTKDGIFEMALPYFHTNFRKIAIER
jgi:hypothetical protein